MNFSAFFRKFTIDSVNKLYFSHKAERVCRECEPFINTGSSILDLGCGRGDMTSVLRAHFNAKVTGADIEDARLIKDFPFYLIDGRSLPLKDKSFDVIFIRYVLHHSSDPIPLLKEAERVVRKKIIIYEDLPEGLFSKIFCKLHGLGWNFFMQPTFQRISFNNTRRWQKLFEELGLRIVHSKKFFSEDGPLYPIKKIFFVLEST